MPLTNPVALDDAAVFEIDSHYQAEDIRRLLKYSRGKEGVGSDLDFDVAAQSTPDMTVAVNAGHAVVYGSQDPSRQGAYLVSSDATASVTLPAADGANPRIDRICIGIFDQDYAGSVYATQLGVVVGTPAGSPTPPALPADGTYYELARVNVRAATASILDSDISDYRTFMDRIGGTAPFTGTGRFVGTLPTPGPPTTGTWNKGDWGFDSNGSAWLNTAAGTPGTWVPAGQRWFQFGGAAGALVGAAPGANSPLLFHADTIVPTADSGGHWLYNLPVTFPNGLLTALFTTGDSGPGLIVGHSADYTASRIGGYVYTPAGALRPGVFRLNYLVIGF